jgi:small subunit ribosomal protein S16
VAVKIKLKRLGKIREPYYRIVVADSRTKRDGRAIEEIGKYHPKAEPSLIEVNSARVQHWLSVGAQPTDPVRHLLTITGDWQKFKGLPGAEGTLKTAEPKADKKDRYDSLVKESLAAKETKAARPTRSTAAKKEQPKKDSAAESKPSEAKASEAKASEAKASEAKADEAKADEAKASEAKADEAKADEAKASKAKASESKASEAKASEAKASEGEVSDTVQTPETQDNTAAAGEAADGGTGA